MSAQSSQNDGWIGRESERRDKNKQEKNAFHVVNTRQCQPIFQNSSAEINSACAGRTMFHLDQHRSAVCADHDSLVFDQCLVI